MMLYTIGKGTGKISLEGLLTVYHSPSTKLIRPWVLKAVPPLVQKVMIVGS